MSIKCSFLLINFQMLWFFPTGTRTPPFLFQSTRDLNLQNKPHFFPQNDLKLAVELMKSSGKCLLRRQSEGAEDGFPINL